MGIYLDIEFNSLKGVFLSIGLYDSETGDKFYAQVSPAKALKGLMVHTFVQNHVLPPIYKHGEYMEYILIANAVQNWLEARKGKVVYADWMEDFIHLANMLYGPDGKKYCKSLTMQLITTPDIHVSEVPHHALYDAIALYKNHKENNYGIE